MKNLKKFMGLLLAVVLCLSLAACGGGGNNVYDTVDGVDDEAPETIENLAIDDSVEYDYSVFLGTWSGEDNKVLAAEKYDDGRVHFTLSDANDDWIASGIFQYVEEYGCVYAHNDYDGIAYLCRFDGDNTLNIDSFGTFSRVSGGSRPDIIGNDWRTWGIVREYGTITRDGEDTVVLVCVHKADATFYLDLEDQVLFDSVDYPITLGDNVWDMFKGIDFADLNGDGNSDVTMKFDDSGSELVMVWIWDTEEGYVFREDLSTLAMSSGDISEYVGLWEYVDENLWLRIYDDATWEFVNDQEDVIQSGTLWVEETGITLHFEDTGDVLQLDRAVSGDLLDGENNGVLVLVDSIQ